MGGGGGMPMGAPSRWDNISNILNLTKDQKKTVKAILDDGCKEAQPLRDQLSKSRLAVADAIQNKKSDDELKQAVAAAGEASAQLSEAELKAFAKIVNSLDETQKANTGSLQSAFRMFRDIFHTKNWNAD